MTVAYQRFSPASISDGGSMASLWLCFLTPSIQFCLLCLPKFCPFKRLSQFLYSLTNESNTQTEGTPTPGLGQWKWWWVWGRTQIRILKLFNSLLCGSRWVVAPKRLQLLSGSFFHSHDPQLQLYSWNFHQPQGASSASRTVLILPECCSVSVVFISWENLGSPGIKGVPPRLFPCLKTLACLQKWLWSGEDHCSGGRALFYYTQTLG